MSRLIFILGNPGTGKSSSMRNFKKDEVAYITVTGKELPFKTDIKVNTAKNMDEVKKVIDISKKKTVVIDDISYLFSREVFDAPEDSEKWPVYDKIFKDFYKKIVMNILSKPTNQNFYLLGHIEETDSSRVMLKTLGKAIRREHPEGWVNIVLEADVDLDEFIFRVRTTGTGVKSPIDMFKNETISNDLKLVDKAINEYYAG